MATHDYVIDNQSAPAFRADLNNALQAIVSQNSSATEPTTTYANMFWYDTASNQLKKRNEANSAWVTLGTIDETLGIFTPSGGPVIATQAEAEAGADNTKMMTPLRVKQSVSVNAPAPTTGEVLGAMAGAVGAEVGSYTIARRSTASDVALGGTVAGSDLNHTSVFWRVTGTTSARALASGGTLTGTWRAMAYYNHNTSTSNDFLGATLWLRIA